ncbi:MAG: hypothetical protein HYY06_01125 [Deltaproteobacteria bacterium]|nr:hypothetical protein [Deltaproteobacteria bacterium]
MRGIERVEARATVAPLPHRPCERVAGTLVASPPRHLREDTDRQPEVPLAVILAVGHEALTDGGDVGAELEEKARVVLVARLHWRSQRGSPRTQDRMSEAADDPVRIASV